MYMLYNLIDKCNILLGRIFFNNLNLFSYNIANYLLKKTFSKKKSHYLANFINHGFQKISNIPSNYIDDLNKLLSKQEEKISSNFQKIVNEDVCFSFEITEEIQEKIFDILNRPLEHFVNELKNYYGMSVVLSNALIRRNYSIDGSSEKFSNFFHTDGYTCALVKVFINLHDMSVDNGPLRYVFKKDAQQILKNNQVNVNRIPEIKEDYLVNHNTGLKGDVFLCNTSDIIHAAGIPKLGFTRDILFFDLCALSKKNILHKIINNNIKKREFPKESYTKIIAKPIGIRGLFKNLLNYI